MKNFIVKKFLSLALAVGMMGSMGGTVFADTTDTTITSSNLEIVTLSNNIDSGVIEEITADLGASLTYEDGTIVDIPAIVTIEKLPATSRTLLEAKQYAVTLSAKVDSDSADKNTSNTTASATLQLIWTDGPGWNNVLDEVSGTLKVIKGEVTKGTVQYGNALISQILWKTEDVGNKSSFKFTPGLQHQTPSASYEVFFKDDSVALTLRVCASIFQ